MTEQPNDDNETTLTFSPMSDDVHSLMHFALRIANGDENISFANILTAAVMLSHMLGMDAATVKDCVDTMWDSTEKACAYINEIIKEQKAKEAQDAQTD